VIINSIMCVLGHSLGATSVRPALSNYESMA